MGYIPQTFKIAVIKSLLKNPNLDPDVLANDRPISNLSFISKIFIKQSQTNYVTFIGMACLKGFRVYYKDWNMKLELKELH